MKLYLFIIAALAVWRITHLLQAESGPFDLFLKLRKGMAIIRFGELANCFYCLSIWIAIPFSYVVGSGWTERVMLWPALSGAAILLERATGQTPVAYFEEEELSDEELLRQSQHENTKE